MKISSLMIKFSSYDINLHFLLPIEFFAFFKWKMKHCFLNCNIWDNSFNLCSFDYSSYNTFKDKEEGN